jgi:ABC-type dipeptide/oligopeptide/nickel transport system permease subunit
MRYLAAAVLGLALVGPFLVPANESGDDDPAGARYLPPLTRAYVVPLRSGSHRVVTSLHRADGGWTGRRAGADVFFGDEEVAGPPAARFYALGTDGLGRDLLDRMLRGARHSVLVAGAGVAVALFLGVLVGTAAGLARPGGDAVLMRFTDVLLATPRFLVYLLCAALFGPSTFLVIVVVGLTTWPSLARLVRASTRALRGHEGILAARAAGCSPARLVVRHLHPALEPAVAVTAALRFSDTIRLEAALSFLGVGSPPPAVSLGAIVASGRGVLADAWWVAAWPGLAIALLVLAVRSAVARPSRLAEPPSVA